MTAAVKHFSEGWHDRQVTVLGRCVDCTATTRHELPERLADVRVENDGGTGVALAAPGPAVDNWQQLRDLMTARIAYCRASADGIWQGGRGAASRRWKLRHEADILDGLLLRMDRIEGQS